MFVTALSRAGTAWYQLLCCLARRELGHETISYLIHHAFGYGLCAKLARELHMRLRKRPTSGPVFEHIGHQANLSAYYLSTRSSLCAANRDTKYPANRY